MKIILLLRRKQVIFHEHLMRKEVMEYLAFTGHKRQEGERKSGNDLPKYLV